MGIFALGLLEMMLFMRSGGEDNYMLKTDYPHQLVPGTVVDEAPQIFQSKLFDEQLSFCSCLHLS